MAQLRAISQHIRYEWWMLHETARALRHSIEPVWQQNAVLECFALHGRVLIDFLWTPPARRHFRTDVLAADYFDPATDWELPSERLPAALRPLSRQANIQMAHLSYRRVGHPSEPWHHIEVAELISQGMTRFVTQALPYGCLDANLDWNQLTTTVNLNA